LTALCCNANVPLYFADEIVDIFCDETECGLILNAVLLSKRRTFLKRMCSRFPSPMAQSLHIGIEGVHPMNYNYQRGLRDSVSIVYFDFLEQVNDLLNDASIFGNLSNFVGTININDPFSNKAPCNDGLIDEVHDAKWYHDTIKICEIKAKGEPYMMLPVIGYIDKTGTDVNQRNKLEPFSFTLSILNRSCHFTSKAWRVLGFIPDLEHKSSAAITRGRSGPIGKGKATRNYHRCLSQILSSLSRNQGLQEPIYGSIRIGDQVARRCLFFPVAFIIGDALSGDQLCGHYRNYSPNVIHLSQCCDVTFNESDNVKWQCHYLYMSDI